MAKRKATWCHWCRIPGHKQDACRHYQAYCVGVRHAIEATTRPARRNNRTPHPSSEEGPSQKKARYGNDNKHDADASATMPAVDREARTGLAPSPPARDDPLPARPVSLLQSSHAKVDHDVSMTPFAGSPVDTVHRSGNQRTPTPDAELFASLGPLSEAERQLMQRTILEYRWRSRPMQASSNGSQIKNERARSSGRVYSLLNPKLEDN
ncbi:hypothetical protein N7457_006646 [Penicillium paradoxum]|uniref:uncharacterized protein n=1 Tax=Penicillium paradoxum TaxID=176176 RepID=UPI0025472487|nr:uncharacterized protein N7457_006646 [Penicillium paradoxum]KAJ5778926.1 hypothetical protein N7457_006646 [Penicillium paradoxum]